MRHKSQTYYSITSLLNAKKTEEALSLMESESKGLTEAEKQECVGNYHFYKGEQQQAINKYEEIITRYPDYYIARYHYILGVKDEVAGRIPEAFNRYATAIEVEPTFVDSYIEMGGLLFKIKDYKGSAKCFERAIEFDPYDLRVFHNLKAVYEVLAKEDPGGYSDKKKRIDADYEMLAKELDSLPDNHLW